MRRRAFPRSSCEGLEFDIVAELTKEQDSQRGPKREAKERLWQREKRLPFERKSERAAERMTRAGSGETASSPSRSTAAKADPLLLWRRSGNWPRFCVPIQATTRS